MDVREDLASILPFLPVIYQSSSIFWPPKALDSIKALSLGPDISRVDSGEILFEAILNLRETLGLTTKLARRAAEGYAYFFDELMDRVKARAWFGETIPILARMLLRLPVALNEHYGRIAEEDDGFGGKITTCGTGLRILEKQESGIVLISQELIATLLVCSLLCIFPTSGRTEKSLPGINFDYLFAALHPNGWQSQEEKIKCLIHYFERISSLTPSACVSFERKVLPLEHGSSISYPEAEFWEKSTIPLCTFGVSIEGFIEDHERESLEVDFANAFLGGGSLHRGCVQEEIRFMINPELIIGMLFLPSMDVNEAIEIVGTERFSNYTGYASKFRFAGDYYDNKVVDSFGRKQTSIVAIDALDTPGMRQYGITCLLRETNKAFCGFFNPAEYQDHLKSIQSIVNKSNPTRFNHAENIKMVEGNENLSDRVFNVSNLSHVQKNIGVATGNWGCGAFGGDPELKSIIQWLAASQASRSFIEYYTFGNRPLQRLKQVTEWILQHEWTVGDLWNILIEYSSLRLNGQTRSGFLNWVLPLPEDDSSRNADFMCESRVGETADGVAIARRVKTRFKECLTKVNRWLSGPGLGRD